MSYHFIEVSKPNSFLRLKNNQICTESPEAFSRQMPLEDTAGVIITSFDCSVHNSFFAGCGDSGIPVLITCQHYRPKSILLPAIRATDTSLLRSDWSFDLRLRKILWEKTISAKIENQAEGLAAWGATAEEVDRLKACAKEGPFHAREARAAKIYWSFWGKNLPNGFSRKRRSGGLNSMLNYAYAVLVSAVTQRLLAVGLDPIRGFGHRHRERACALTYDVMEPFRLIADHAVWKLRDRVATAVDSDGVIRSPDCRKQLAGILLSNESVGLFGKQGLQLIENTIRSLRRALLEKRAGIYQPWKFKYTKWAGF